MSEITISDALCSELERLSGPVTLRSQSGRKVGDFTPEPLVPWDPSITREELDRRAAEPGRTWAEIRQRLSPKTAPPDRRLRPSAT
jgi:hypothetical protein